MDDNVFARSGDEAPVLASPRAFNTILYGGLVVGLLDGLYAVVFNGLKGVSPVRVFQFVASGLLGRASFSGGTKTALVGVLLHFVVAFIVAAVYYAVSLGLPMLIRRAILCGLLYGAMVYCVMNYLVLPLSAAPRLSFTFTEFVIGVIGHALIVGLPVALIARQSARRTSRDYRKPV